MLVGYVYGSAQDEASQIYRWHSCDHSGSGNGTDSLFIQIREAIFMEDGRQIVTLADIKKYIRKENIYAIVCLTCTFLLLFWELLETDNTKLDIIALIFSILLLFGIGRCLLNIIKIQKNTFFHLRTDELINKADDINTFLHGHETHRLYFCQGHYDMRVYGRYCGPEGTWYSICNMGTKTIYDTAFIGDSFTLVCIGKRIHLAFNNKLFDIQDDL